MKRLSVSLLFFLLISSFMFAIITFSPGNVKAQTITNINGIISQDTIWTKTNSPYNFTGNVILNYGVKLTLEPGTIVNLNGYCFDINGNFSAVGTTSNLIQIIGLGHTYGSDINRIKFSGLNNGWDEQTQTGTILENCIIKMALIQVEGVSLKLASNDLTSVYVSLFSGPYGGTFAPIISKNVFISGVGIGIVVNTGTTVNATITNNIINNLDSQNYGASGINIQGNGNDISTIQGNYIRGNQYGIRIITSSQATISNNCITENKQGISFLNNTLYLKTDPTPQISYNNIYGNTYNVFSNRSTELVVTYNWWGTNNTQEISQLINCSNPMGTVNYTPFLNTSNQQAPPYLNTSAGTGGLTPFPTPTPLPTTTPTPAPTPSPSSSPSPSPTPTNTPNPSPTPTPTPTSSTNQNSTTLIVSCTSSTSYSGFNVVIQGNLVSNGIELLNAPILLSYSVNGGKSYQDLTLVNTASDGSFSASWLPPVTGNYLIKATFEGDNNSPAVSKTVNLAVTEYSQENIFSVSSNSSVSTLSFNSTSKELSFTVTGDSGTFGFADVYIAKSLVNDASSIKVYLDDNSLAYSVSPIGDSWLLHLTYTHSSHTVIVNIDSAINQTNGSIGNWVIYIAIILAVALIAVTVLVFLKKKKKMIALSNV